MPADLIIFGGTFDPPHLGHSSCLLAAHQAFPKARIIVIPSIASPTGINTSKAPKASFADRFHMCELAFTSLELPLEISRIEENLPTPSYTIQTINALKANKQTPIKRFALIIGKDQLQAFSSWKEPKAILKDCDLIVMDRQTDDRRSIDDLVLQLGEKLFLEVREASKKHCWEVRDPHELISNIYTLSHKMPEPSSTLSRKSLQDLHPDVAAYVRCKNFYISRQYS